MFKITDEHHLLAIKNRVKFLQKPNELLKLTQKSLTKSNLEKNRKKSLFILFVLLFVSLIISSVSWFVVNISPINSKSDEAVVFSIIEGENQTEISTKLKQLGLIRNQLAFNIYNYFAGTSSKLQAGKYKIFKRDSLPEIIKKITTGSGSELIITFYPGNNLMQNREILIKHGFSVDEINKAFNIKYDHPIMAIKPESNDIEGFLYADTYHYFVDADLKTIFYKAFDEIKKIIDDYSLVDKFKAKGLTIYEGIIIASIIQKEVNSPVGDNPSDDQRTISGIFYNRLASHMNLGSDVTYQYIADKIGTSRSPNLDNPYNTRKFNGLPPGPVSTPTLSSLVAASDPINSNFYYFLSGDDNKMHYASTNAEHENNAAIYCRIKCKSN